MKNALILHGADSNPQNNWFPWLKEELEKKGYTVWIPELPNSGTPILDDWLKTIFANHEWDWNAESIIIGHSAGATFTARLLEKLPLGITINKAIMVAPYANRGTKPEYFKYKDGMLEKPFHWGKIRSTCKRFYFIASNNDQYQCGANQSAIFHKELGGELILKPGQGHFNLATGPQYQQFPFLLSLVD